MGSFVPPFSLALSFGDSFQNIREKQFRGWFSLRMRPQGHWKRLMYFYSQTTAHDIRRLKTKVALRPTSHNLAASLKGGMGFREGYKQMVNQISLWSPDYIPDLWSCNGAFWGWLSFMRMSETLSWWHWQTKRNSIPTEHVLFEFTHHSLSFFSLSLPSCIPSCLHLDALRLLASHAVWGV